MVCYGERNLDILRGIYKYIVTDLVDPNTGKYYPNPQYNLEIRMDHLVLVQHHFKKGIVPLVALNERHKPEEGMVTAYIP